MGERSSDLARIIAERDRLLRMRQNLTDQVAGLDIAIRIIGEVAEEWGEPLPATIEGEVRG